MRLLLDTHIFLWALSIPERLDPDLRRAVASPASAVYLSAASAWEIAIKSALGRLDFPLERFESILDEMGLERLSIRHSHAIAAGRLPRHHDDPFDRMLIAQARAEGLQLVTTDAAFAAYEVTLFGNG